MNSFKPQLSNYLDCNLFYVTLSCPREGTGSVRVRNEYDLGDRRCRWIDRRTVIRPSRAAPKSRKEVKDGVHQCIQTSLQQGAQ